MAKKWAQGIYEVKNPQKYIGKGKPKYRSSWEMMFFNFCDNDPSVLKWASESITIPYRNPITGKQTIYIPDIFMFYKNKHGQEIAELIEIKPKSQTSLSEAKNAREKAVVLVNQAKWTAAMAYCKRMGMVFRVITENQLFKNGKT